MTTDEYAKIYLIIEGGNRQGPPLAASSFTKPAQFLLAAKPSPEAPK